MVVTLVIIFAGVVLIVVVVAVILVAVTISFNDVMFITSSLSPPSLLSLIAPEGTGVTVNETLLPSNVSAVNAATAVGDDDDNADDDTPNPWQAVLIEGLVVVAVDNVVLLAIKLFSF